MRVAPQPRSAREPHTAAPHAIRPTEPTRRGIGTGSVSAPLPVVRGNAEVLQRSVGNQAVGHLVAVQRVDAAALTEFRGYVAEGDWARAAWVLDTWDAGDIARQVRSMPTAQLESLVEGAWHGGKSNVDAAVRAVNPRAAVVGAVRVLVWSHRWDEAAEQLDKLEHKDAMAFSKALLAAGRIDEDQLRMLIVRSPNLQFNPGDAVKIGAMRYVVYVETVRYSGTFAWRNNNPGNLKSWPGAQKEWGSIGVDDMGFLIFPEMSLGWEAIKKNLVAKAQRNPTILGTMEEYAPRHEKGNDPDLYAAKIVAALGKGFTPSSVLPQKEPELTTIVETITRTEGTVKGEEVPHTSNALPIELLGRLTP